MTQNKMTKEKKSPFQARRIIAVHQEKIKAPASKIFPLACPVEELKWINGWEGQFKLIYTDSGVNENNCIFEEYMSGPVLFDKPVTATWATTLHDPESNQVQFLIMLEGVAVIKFDLNISEAGNDNSDCSWHFTFTTLKEEAVKQKDEVIKERLQMMLAFLAQSLKYYCETGKISGAG